MCRKFTVIRDVLIQRVRAIHIESRKRVREVAVLVHEARKLVLEHFFRFVRPPIHKIAVSVEQVARAVKPVSDFVSNGEAQAGVIQIFHLRFFGPVGVVDVALQEGGGKTCGNYFLKSRS